MRELADDFFTYVWVMHRIADRYDERGTRRVGTQGLAFGEALYELSSAEYTEVRPYKTKREVGTWRGAAWFSSDGLDQAVKSVKSLKQPGKNLLNRKKNVAISFDRFLRSVLFEQLERSETTLAELLARHDDDVRAFRAHFGRGTPVPIYRGPVVLSTDIRQTTKRKRKEERAAAEAAKPRPERISWLAILPRNVIPLLAHRKALRVDTPTRLLLAQGKLRLFATESAGVDGLANPRWSTPSLVQAVAEFHGGRVIESTPSSTRIIADFDDGEQTYWFMYREISEKNIFPNVAADTDTIVCVDSKPLSATLQWIAKRLTMYHKESPIALWTSETSAAVWSWFPWLWHRPEGKGMVRPKTFSDMKAQVTVMWAASALHALLGFYMTAELVRGAAAFLGITDSFDAAVDGLHERELLDRDRAAYIPVSGPPITADVMIAHEKCREIVHSTFEWLWFQTPPMENAAAALRRAIDAVAHALPSIRETYHPLWVERFAGTREVLFEQLRAAMSAGRYEEAADLMLQLSAMGERDMLDVMWRDRFGSLRVGGSTEELLRASRAAMRSGRGISRFVDALLQRKDDAAVSSFLREIRPHLPEGSFPRVSIEKALVRDS